VHNKQTCNCKYVSTVAQFNSPLGEMPDNAMMSTVQFRIFRLSVFTLGTPQETFIQIFNAQSRRRVFNLLLRISRHTQKNVYISIKYLFQATFEGWMEAMQDVVDSTEVCIKLYARHRENDRSFIRLMNAAVLELVLITAGDYGISKAIESPSSLQFSLSAVLS